MRKMILLLGGTSETAPLAKALVEQGFSVLVSTATDIPLDIGNHPAVRRRTGLLDEPQLTRLLLDERIRGVVDATHPYAEAIGPLARKIAGQLHLPYFRWLRPAALFGSSEILSAADHAEAAALAFPFGTPVLLTIGSKNLEPYIRESRMTGIPVIARVLDHPDSLAACQKLGLSPEAIVTGKGPFSVDENRSTIQNFRIGVLVTKDSGVAGGVPGKLQAAKLEGCRVVVVRRPEPPGKYFDQLETLIKVLLETLIP
jgi:precorrin-6A/cobalt-precorrin-6A reductase